jgi:hypothetical protein
MSLAVPTPPDPASICRAKPSPAASRPPIVALTCCVHPHAVAFDVMPPPWSESQVVPTTMVPVRRAAVFHAIGPLCKRSRDGEAVVVSPIFTWSASSCLRHAEQCFRATLTRLDSG